MKKFIAATLAAMALVAAAVAVSHYFADEAVVAAYPPMD